MVKNILFLILVLLSNPISSQIEHQNLWNKIEKFDLKQLKINKQKLLKSNRLDNEANLIFLYHEYKLFDEEKSFEILLDLADTLQNYSSQTKLSANIKLVELLLQFNLLEESSERLDVLDELIKKNYNENANHSIIWLKSTLYYELKDYVKSIIYQEKGLKQPLNLIERASAYNNLALTEVKINKITSAFRHYEMGIQLVASKKNINEKEVFYLLTGNIGSLYLKLKDYSKANYLLNEEYAFYKEERNFPYNLAANIIDLIKIRKNQAEDYEGLFKELIENLELINDIYKKHEVIQKAKNELMTLLTVEQKKTIFKLSEKIQHKLIENELKNLKEHTKKLYSSNIRTLLKSNDLERQKNILLDKNNSLKSAILIILCISLFVILFIYYKYRKQMIIKLDQSKLIQTQQNELLNNNQKIYEMELLHQKEQLTSLSFNLKVKKDIEEQFLKKIKSLKNKRNINSDAIINELQVSIYSLKEVDRKLDVSISEQLDFSKELSQILKIKHPELTKKEIEFCQLCLFGFSSKEIGQITGQTDGAVRVYKNKIKNKIGLAKEIDLAEYISNMKKMTI